MPTWGTVPQSVSLLYTGSWVWQQKTLSDPEIQDQEALHRHTPQTRQNCSSVLHLPDPPAYFSTGSEFKWEREWFYPGSSHLVPSIMPPASPWPKPAEKGKNLILSGDPVRCLGSKQPMTSGLAIPCICQTIRAWLFSSFILGVSWDR